MKNINMYLVSFLFALQVAAVLSIDGFGSNAIMWHQFAGRLVKL
jgi:hypothetical protein